MQTDFDKDLLAYFTDVQPLRDAFKDLVSAPMLTKRLFVIHGVGGIGKSSLLRMFRLHCKTERIPVAMASGDEAKSALDALLLWVEDLKVDAVTFHTFDKTLRRYRNIQAKVNAEAKKTTGTRGASIANQAASKTAEAAGGALAGAVIGSVIPGIGTTIGGALGSVLGGMGVNALTDWLYGFLTKPDIDLLLNPTKKLADDFIYDLSQAARKHRIVLIIDTFEQMTAFDNWVCNLSQKLNSNTLIVIAGRAMPNWNRSWHSWMSNAYVEELKPMSEAVMSELIVRYYSTMRGGIPDPKQVDAIIRFARGLPMVVTSAVQLWVKYGVEDFLSVKTEIVTNLVDRLVEGVPSELIPALEAASIVRWFDQPILRAVTGLAEVREVYTELRRFPFVRARVEGLALHDTVREIMEENLRVHDSERHIELHRRAARFFDDRIKTASAEDSERLGLEHLYHSVRADEPMGIFLFQTIAEEMTRYRLVNRLRALLNDVNTYQLELSSSKLWRAYYVARIEHLEGNLEDAEQRYQDICRNKNADSKLRAYSLNDWGLVLVASYRDEQAITVLKESLSLHGVDQKLVSNYFYLSSVYQRDGRLDESLNVLLQAKEFFEKADDFYGSIDVLNRLKGYHLYLGDVAQATSYLDEAKKLFAASPTKPKFLEIELLARWAIAWAWAGFLSQTEKDLSATIKIASDLGSTSLELIDNTDVLRDYAYVMGLQERYREAEQYFGHSLETTNRKLVTEAREASLGITMGLRGHILTRKGEFDHAEQDLHTSLRYKLKVKDVDGIPECYVWLGELHETQFQRDADTEHLLAAEQCYADGLSYRWVGRRYFECAALTGLARVKYAQGANEAVMPLIKEARELATKYQYNDHQASLHLSEAQLKNIHNSFDIMDLLGHLEMSLIHALRHNRFLLDEILSGRTQGSPLQPIIPYCVSLGDIGRQILVNLRNWWKQGISDNSITRSSAISPILEGVSLLEAEQMARKREPGNGLYQQSVIEQFEVALDQLK